MDAPESPFILTKLHVPALRPRTVARTRLLERLTLEPGLILVCAPAGYGKSTLLAAWARALPKQGIAVAWYALDDSDDIPPSFGSYLVASLSQALGSTSDLTHLSQRLRASPELDLAHILPAIINAIATSERECVLIFDDYHVIGAPAIHSALAFLLDHRPQNLHVVIGSRSDPPLPLARLRARGQLFELRAADLRFNLAETTAFLNEVMRLDLSVEIIDALEERTEGWVAGLQLAALSLSGQADQERFIAAFTGSHRYLVEYLLDEVVGQQPEEIQTFLRATSILDRLCGPVCDALLAQSTGSAALLDRLEQTNLFVLRLDDNGYWYRYHHLFRDFLQTQLHQTQPERKAELHRAASEWYAAQGFLREAVQHAFQTADWEYAATVVEQHCFTLIMHSDIATIYEWCSAFPEAVMQTHPQLCLHQCWAWVFSFRRQNRSRVEARLQQVTQALAWIEDPLIVRILTEQAAVIRSFLKMAPDPAVDPREELVLAQRALDAYSTDDPARFSNLLTSAYVHLALHDARSAQASYETARQIAVSQHLYFGIAESTFNLARLAHSQGHLRRALVICREGQTDIAALLPHPEQELPAVGSLDIALGCVLLEQDQLAAAEQHLLHGLELIGGGLNPNYLFTACVALFRLREMQGRSDEALSYLNRLEEAWPDIAFCTTGLRLELALRSTPQNPATRAEAQAWCEDFASALREQVVPFGLGPFGAAEVYYLSTLIWLNTQITMGNASAAQPYLEAQLTLAEQHDVRQRVIELSLLQALSARAAGNDRLTWQAVQRALRLAQPEGYVRTFDQGIALNQLLSEAAGRGLFPEYIDRLLAVIDPAQKPETPGRVARSGVAGSATLEAGERLSERELEVLRLMARGASNQLIAQQLVITVGTVKSHINHILGKLEAHNRTEAVARARELGLLEI
ncbi:MAG TPA: LuxR C-terminal-related transcriptional regulator [Anaerolineae bacterium]|nr:LuxR C-terminal-related transcriptional regulator [Anaerolineae bacterium]